MLLMHDMRLTTIDQLSSEPWRVDGCEIIGPTPFAFTMHHTKNTMPAMGVTMDLSVKRWRLIVLISECTAHASLNKETLRTFGEWGTRLLGEKSPRKGRST